ncbi:hypothetical protein ACF0H5_015575 [Mactra antiquata]
MLETKHHWLPVFIALYLPISFIITYSIAVANDHVEPGFPYISDTGTKSPESCVFGQLLNIGAVIAGIIVYVRYRHIHTHFVTMHGRNGIIKLNQAAFVCGMMTNLGVSLVGNFQETNIISVHLFGAFLAFGIGFVYMILQTIISYKSDDVAVPGTSLNIRRFRLILCIADVILLLTLTIVSQMAIRKWKNKNEEDSRQKWSANDPGYTEHVIATSSEWVVAFVTVAFFASFYAEFKHFRMKPAEVQYYVPEGLKESNEIPAQETSIAVIS